MPLPRLLHFLRLAKSPRTVETGAGEGGSSYMTASMKVRGMWLVWYGAWVGGRVGGEWARWGRLPLHGSFYKGAKACGSCGSCGLRV